VNVAISRRGTRQERLDPSAVLPGAGTWKVRQTFEADADVVLHEGGALEFLRSLPGGSVSLVISSPPYNVGKEYETTIGLERYLTDQKPVLSELVRVLRPEGSLCWQVGNFVDGPESFPLDIFYYPLLKALGLKLRNRIVWSFGHGMHMTKRLSPRYETLLWFTKSDRYTFNLDDIRVPSKYPGKRHFKGPKAGLPSGNPLGKNPSDLWTIVRQDWESGVWEIPNVKAAHPEKTLHPCQFPVELAERCVLAFTNPKEFVLDPYAGVASAAIAALTHDRRAIAIEREHRYVQVARERIAQLEAGTLPMRPLGRPIMMPTGREKWSRVPSEWKRDGIRTVY
jgi:adenine-specific DNA-methyltransferase